MNQATSDVFKNTTNIRKFSTNSLRGGSCTLSQTLDTHTRGSILTAPRDSYSQDSGRLSQNSSITKRGSILSNVGVEGIEDTVRLRKEFKTF